MLSSKNKKTKSEGLSLSLVKHISKSKNEPKWMLDKRVKAFKLWENNDNKIEY